MLHKDGYALFSYSQVTYCSSLFIKKSECRATIILHAPQETHVSCSDFGHRCLY
ncbi:hypothetical protein BVRB_4g089970 [Beta vulgaris subsp. vulgaris]|nr:hypothetical protein BVRB_4g089970 [Beta vulgaris subsp. vulgaris]